MATAIEISLFSARETDEMRSNCSDSIPGPVSFPFGQHSGLDCLFIFMP